jgi:hypothetical protein
MELVAWQANVQDDEGNAVPEPVVTVRDAVSGDPLSVIYNMDGDAISNPITGTLGGFVQFQVLPGKYIIEGAKGGSSTDTWFFDALNIDWTQPFPNRAAAIDADIPDSINTLEVIHAGRRLKYLPDDNGTAITTNGGARKWSPDGDVTLEHFGGGDLYSGVNDNSAARDAAIAWLKQNRGTAAQSEWRKIHIGSGRYVFQSAPTEYLTRSNWDIAGEGSGATYLDLRYPGPLFVIDSASQAAFNIHIHGFEANGRLSATHAGTRIVQVLADDTNAGAATRYCRFYDISFQNIHEPFYVGKTGAVLKGSFTGMGGHGPNYFYNLLARPSELGRETRASIVYQGGCTDHHQFFNSFLRGTVAGIIINDDDDDVSTGDIEFLNIHFASGTPMDTSILINGPVTSTHYNQCMLINGCQFDGPLNALTRVKRMRGNILGNADTAGSTDHDRTDWPDTGLFVQARGVWNDLRATVYGGDGAQANSTAGRLDTDTSKLARVGAFGHGSTVQPIWPNSSLNNVSGVGAGIYRTDGTISNIPLDVGVVYFSVRSSASFQYVQKYTNLNGIELTRTSSGGSAASPAWGPWQAPGGRLIKAAAAFVNLSSGAFTATHEFHRVDTEGEASTDDLVNINGGTDGDTLIIASATTSRPVVVKSDTGNIRCGTDRTLNSSNDRITLQKFGDNWIMLSFADNG